MIKNLLFVIYCFLAFAGFGQAQEKACTYSEKFIGIWLLDDLVFDLSGENLEEEGQSWEIKRQEEENEVEGKFRLTISPDGSATAVLEADGENEPGYGYWKLSADCQLLTVTIDQEDVEFGVVAVDGSRLVLEMSDHDESTEINQPVKMVMLRVER